MSILEAPPSAAPQARRRPMRIMAVLASLMALNSISTDMYLPAMPQMARDMSAGAGELEYTVSGYLIGFSLGQLLWGAVSDRFGRRIPIAIGLVLFDIGSAGCALSGTATEVIGWRFVQAVGACAGVVLARAMVRDLFERDRAAQMLSTLITIMAVAPLVGPLIGGQVLTFASWPWTFWFMVVIGGGLLAALFTLPETLPPEHRDRHAVRHALGRYGELLRDRRILAFTGIGGFFYIGVYAYMGRLPVRLHQLLSRAAALLRTAVRLRYPGHHGDQHPQRPIGATVWQRSIAALGCDARRSGGRVRRGGRLERTGAASPP